MDQPGVVACLGRTRTLVRIQPSRLLWKGKPKGDGTRLEPGRATSLEGSTPSPSALDVNDGELYITGLESAAA